jgi:hypothetical protein
MNAVAREVSAEPARAARYARVLKMSKKVEWQIDRDLIRGREFDFSRKFLPDGLSFVDRLPFLGADDARLLSQIQGRTYAYIFGLVERFISAKMLEQSRGHVLGDQLALEGLVRFSAEEIKHQELFRRMEQMIGAEMPPGYRMVADPNDVARAVLAASSWSVLALTCHIELFVQAHYDQSIAPREEVCPLFRDVFFYHWKDECQHVMLDELEWTSEHAKLTDEERDGAVNDLIGRRVLPGDRRPRFQHGPARSAEERRARRLSLAVHHLGRAAHPFRPAADLDDHPRTDGADPAGAGAHHAGLTADRLNRKCKGGFRCLRSSAHSRRSSRD